MLAAMFTGFSFTAEGDLLLHRICGGYTMLMLAAAAVLAMPVLPLSGKSWRPFLRVRRGSRKAVLIWRRFCCWYCALRRLLPAVFRRLSMLSFEVDHEIKDSVSFIVLFLLICLVPSAGMLLSGPSGALANEIPARSPEPVKEGNRIRSILRS